jgi:hypothetical protein
MIALLVLFILTVSAGSWAAAPALSSFDPFGLYDVTLTPSISIGTLGPYELALGNSATLTSGAYTYDITNIFGFYAIGGNFTATASDIGDWAFDTNYAPPGAAVAGWDNNSKSQAITRGTSKQFTFTTFAVDNVTEPSDAMMGLHVTLDLANKPSPFASGGDTGFVYDDGGGGPIEIVPEASTLIGFGSALAMAGPRMIGWLRKRRS